MAVLTDGPGPGRTAGNLGERFGAMTRYAGAAVSLALVAGVGVWGYKLVMRDVNGIPVVRAMEGPMRIAPDDPGGEVAAHTGLAVNAIAAVGEAAPPEDVLMLAPATPDLAPEDIEVEVAVFAAEAPLIDVDGTAPDTAPESASDTVQVTAVSTAPSDAPLTAEQVLALADQIAAGVDPLGALAPEAAVSLTPAAEATAIAGLIPADVPGVSRSLRPMARPATAPTLSAVTPVAAEEPATLTADLPVGTALVQLGAFETVDLAAAEWGRLSGRFAEFMGGKSRVIMEATSGGRTFYRLRASGFADLADARRFCAALVAEDAACIPVVVR